jgi:hypothetical protein
VQRLLSLSYSFICDSLVTSTLCIHCGLILLSYMSPEIYDRLRQFYILRLLMLSHSRVASLACVQMYTWLNVTAVGYTLWIACVSDVLPETLELSLCHPCHSWLPYAGSRILEPYHRSRFACPGTGIPAIDFYSTPHFLVTCITYSTSGPTVLFSGHSHFLYFGRISPV